MCVFVRKIIWWWLLFSFLWLNLLLVTVFVIIVITLFYTTTKHTITRIRYFSHRVSFLIWYDILVIFTSFVRRFRTKKMERWIKILKRSSTRQFMRQDRSWLFCLLVSSVFLNSFWLIDCTRVNFDFTPWGKKMRICVI